ncbi:hypothetical protein, partial [Alistipes sp.]|uniref:hypothetical protein n=1 Tax=Alistipes sp. TaxID=1872444 RepID=UPI004027F224
MIQPLSQRIILSVSSCCRCFCIALAPDLFRDIMRLSQYPKVRDARTGKQPSALSDPTAYPERGLFGVRDSAGFANDGDLHLTRRLSVPVSSRLVLALSRADLSGRPASVYRVPTAQKSPPF